MDIVLSLSLHVHDIEDFNLPNSELATFKAYQLSLRLYL